jgi:hypothetical protein
MWGALSDERAGLSFARVTVSSNKSVYMLINVYIYIQHIQGLCQSRLELSVILDVLSVEPSSKLYNEIPRTTVGKSDFTTGDLPPIS